jgi:hypothetical protein
MHWLFRHRLRGLAIATAVFSLLFTYPAVAFAASTPDTCDSVPKYYCVHADYDPGAGTATIYNRWYEGAVDGGAKEWQRHWVADFSWTGSYWATIRSWNIGNWYRDVCLCHPNGHWESLRGGTIPQPATVMVRLRYHETVPSHHFWCSPHLEHHLYDSTSIQWGNSSC